MNNTVSNELINKSDESVNGIINPFNKNNKSINENKIQNILKKYGVYQNIQNLNLYTEALTHTSYTIEKINEVCSRDNLKVAPNPDGYILLKNNSYERLEFLGDGIIESIIVSYVYNRFIGQPEGFLSFMKVNLVNRITLSHLTRVIGLDEYLIISRTLDEINNSRNDDKILCDIFESFIGAIFIDFNNSTNNGYLIAEKFLINLIEDESTGLDFTEMILNDTNYKDKFIKYNRNINKLNPSFNVVENIGMGNDKKIIVHITNPKNNEIIGKGEGNTIKKAEQAASKDGLIKLGLLNS